LVADTVIAMGLDPAIAISACSDSDKITELNMVMATAMDLEEGVSRNLAYAATLDRALPLATVMATSTATDTAINSEKGVDMVLDPNIAFDKGSDTPPVQPQASAMTSVTAMDLEQTVDSDDNGSRFSQGASSEEFEFTGDDDVTKAKKKKIRITFIISEKKIAFDN
jgi:hypothetical protein